MILGYKMPKLLARILAFDCYLGALMLLTLGFTNVTTTVLVFGIREVKIAKVTAK